jgi:hypothetical protein
MTGDPRPAHAETRQGTDSRSTLNILSRLTSTPEKKGDFFISFSRDSGEDDGGPEWQAFVVDSALYRNA